jgi:predicted Fe-S protein YdhL (DUF1289 family)
VTEKRKRARKTIASSTKSKNTLSLMAQTDRPSPIESPCNKVCVIDAASGLCIGCGRSLVEIGGWIAMTADERRRIMAELPARRAAMPRTGTT